MYGGIGGRGSGGSSIQQERMRKLQKSIRLKKLNGQLSSALSFNANPVDSLSEHSGSLRKFNSTKNDGIFDEHVKMAFAPYCNFDTPSVKKIVPKQFALFRSNENSNIPNVRKVSTANANGVKDELDQTALPDAEKMDFPGVSCSNAPTSSNAFVDGKHCSSALSHRRNSESFDPSKHDQGELESWIKRKFYIVENSGKATEVYCTDLIHRARQGIGRQGTDGSHTLLRVVDRWREEWNHGVQMPLGTSRETFHFENTALFPKMAESELFQLHGKLITAGPSTKYIQKNAKDYLHVARQQIFYYNMDHDDELWLEGPIAGGEESISSRTFVETMNYLEIITYKKIHDALLEPEPVKRSRGHSEDDAACIICRLPVWETGDQIVFCDGCNIPVHQVCYGIATVPTGPWLCQLCSHFGTPTMMNCLFCPIRGGAMKATKCMDSWAHVVCALFIAEVRFGDAEAREPITHVNEIPAEKWQARCCVCDTHLGACIKCTYPKCEERFHVSCAQQSDFVLGIENDEREKNGVKYVSLCHSHSTKTSRKEHRQIRFNKNRLDEMHKNFDQYVDSDNVANYLKISPKIVKRIYEYWIWKRRQNNCQPLIGEPEYNNLKLDSQTGSLSRQRKSTVGRKRQMIPVESAEFEAIPRKKLLENYEDIRHLRVSFERARNLCYMVAKREKLKGQREGMFERQVKRTAKNVFSRVIPVSARRMEKLLEEWRQSAQLEEDGKGGKVW